MRRRRRRSKKEKRKEQQRRRQGREYSSPIHSSILLTRLYLLGLSLRQLTILGRLAIQDNFTLLEIPPRILINQDQAQIVPRTIFLIHVAKRRRQIKTSQKQSNGNRLPATRTPIHNFKAHQRLRLIVLIRRHTRRFASNDGEFHMANFEADEQEVDATHNDIFEMIFRFGVFEFNV